MPIYPYLIIFKYYNISIIHRFENQLLRKLTKMKSSWNHLNQRLEKYLVLKKPAIAITFSQKRPDQLDQYSIKNIPKSLSDGRTGKVPAGCVFWFESEKKAFTTKPEDHFNCSVGSVTHGLKLLNSVMNNQDIQSILQSQWVKPEEAMNLPVIQNQPNYISYHPLKKIQTDPDVILIKINAYQAMLIHDCIENIGFAGKPQCHIIPLAKEKEQISISTGCMLSRIRTQLPNEFMTCAIPGNQFEAFVEKLEVRHQANQKVSTYAYQDRQRFAKINT